MQNARQQHFDWEPRATAHKSSWTLTSTVVCEPGETAHKSSSTRTNAVVCEPGETAHKSSSTSTVAVVWEPGQTGHKSSSTRTSAVVCEPGQTAHKSSSRRTNAVVCEPSQTLHNPHQPPAPSCANPVKLRSKRHPICLSPGSCGNPVHLRITRVGQATCHQCAEIRRVAEGSFSSPHSRTLFPRILNKQKRAMFPILLS